MKDERAREMFSHRRPGCTQRTCETDILPARQVGSSGAIRQFSSSPRWIHVRIRCLTVRYGTGVTGEGKGRTRMTLG